MSPESTCSPDSQILEVFGITVRDTEANVCISAKLSRSLGKYFLFWYNPALRASGVLSSGDEISYGKYCKWAVQTLLTIILAHLTMQWRYKKVA
ncbi:hypothetical protein Hypma_016286 [Hypsizygus marmoreus]|uniref:Uncharacterized protein n=1 Tax=Hypsizygus marmoreus TaxID=39966 RepID=A0A369IY59_HYPMA|nr:hypothetical protein Hypma_016286 [Hypsizygus marmoreus]